MAEKDEQVSHEDLDNAIEPDPESPAEEASEEEEIKTDESEEASPPEDESETPEKDEEKEEIPDEPEDNTARSKLGRRVSAIESSVQTLADSVNTFIESQKKPEPKDEDDELDEEEDIRTIKDLDAYLDRREKQKQKAETEYHADYNAHFVAVERSTDDPDLHKQIMEELQANHNFKRTNDGARDAEVNYKDAQIAVLKKSVGKPKENPLDKNKDKKVEKLGGPSETKVDTKAKPVVKLDKHAQSLIDDTRKTNKDLLSDESVQDALEGETSGRFLNPLEPQ